MRSSSTLARTFAFLVVVGLALVACGQKAGVHQGLVGQPGVDPGIGTPTDPNAPIGPTDPNAPIDPTDPNAPIDPTDPNTPVDPTDPNSPVIGSDRTGISDTEIVIGLHAPETGAAPVQSKVFAAGREMYWKYLQNDLKQTVYGRTVRVVTADDQYTPSVAVSVCNKMATQDKAFLLIGGAGTDQINACAQFANQRGIPYLSPGVQETGLSSLRTYFAVTMTYRQQMQPFVDMLRAESKRQDLDVNGDGDVKIGFVRPNTPNFNDADAALEAAVKAAKWDYSVYSVSKDSTSSEAQTVATQLQQDKIDIVNPITAPTFTVQLAIQTGKNNYRPLYAGVSITNNINQMITLACQNDQFEGALFLSPWPGWEQVNAGQYDPDFAKAANKYAADFNKRDKGGDLLLALWGIMKHVHQMFLQAGPDMTREHLVSILGGYSANPSAFPTLACSATSHFCAKDTFVLEGSCNHPDGAQYVTPARYKKKASSF